MLGTLLSAIDFFVSALLFLDFLVLTLLSSISSFFQFSSHLPLDFCCFSFFFSCINVFFSSDIQLLYAFIRSAADLGGISVTRKSTTSFDDKTLNFLTSETRNYNYL